MTWTLVERDLAGAEIRCHILKTSRTLYLVGLEGGVSVEDHIMGDLFARMTTEAWGAKLEPIHDLSVQPALPRTNGRFMPRQEQNGPMYPLTEPEVFFLRDGDSIFLKSMCNEAPGTPLHLTLNYDPSEVQVNSSAAADADVSSSEDRVSVKGEIKQEIKSENSETDEKVLDQTPAVVVPQSSRIQPQATPVPSTTRSEVVQETPVTDRSRSGPESSAAEQQINSSISSEDAPGDTPIPGTLEDINDPLSEFQPSVDRTVGGDSEKRPRRSARSTDTTKSPEYKLASSPTKKAASDSTEGTPRPLSADEVPATASSSGNEDPPTSNIGQGSSTYTVPTARMAISHPSVQIPSHKGRGKRTNHPSDDGMPEPARPSKRARFGDTTTTTEAKANIRKSKPAASIEGPTREPSRRKSKSASVIEEPTPDPVSKPAFDKSLYQGEPPVIALSNSTLADRDHLLRFFRRDGLKKVESVQEGECNLLCVGNGPLRKSMKLLLCVALGIPIVTDRWLMDSVEQKQLLDTKLYMPKDAEKEREWGFSLANVWGKPQRAIFDNLSVYFTPALKKSYTPFKEVNTVCKAVGFTRVIDRSAKQVLTAYDKDGNDIIFLGLETKDPDCATLIEKGYTVYTRDFLTTSILRGRIDRDSDEFKLKSAGSQSQGSQSKTPAKKSTRSQSMSQSSQSKTPAKRGRPRKSVG